MSFGADMEVGVESGFGAEMEVDVEIDFGADMETGVEIEDRIVHRRQRRNLF